MLRDAVVVDHGRAVQRLDLLLNVEHLLFLLMRVPLNPLGLESLFLILLSHRLSNLLDHRGLLGSTAG